MNKQRSAKTESKSEPKNKVEIPFFYSFPQFLFQLIAKLIAFGFFRQCFSSMTRQ